MARTVDLQKICGGLPVAEMEVAFGYRAPLPSEHRSSNNCSVFCRNGRDMPGRFREWTMFRLASLLRRMPSITNKWTAVVGFHGLILLRTT